MFKLSPLSKTRCKSPLLQEAFPISTARSNLLNFLDIIPPYLMVLSSFFHLYGRVKYVKILFPLFDCKVLGVKNYVFERSCKAKCI